MNGLFRYRIRPNASAAQKAAKVAAIEAGVPSNISTKMLIRGSDMALLRRAR